MIRDSNDQDELTTRGEKTMQSSLFDDPSPSDIRDKDAAHRALDELFTLARQYNSSKDYLELMRFVGSFRNYAPFNAMLVHVQRPGATFAASASRWAQVYGRRIRPGASPLVILQPMGPVMFVFDVSDTEPEEGAPPLPKQVLNPFEVRAGQIGSELPETMENTKRDGVRVTNQDASTNSAGFVRTAKPGLWLNVLASRRPEPNYVVVPVRYELVLNLNNSPEAQYATLVHELAHLYCSHLGTPNPKWWTDRRGLNDELREFEAESVCYLLCSRLGIDNPSDEYLAGYVNSSTRTPPISLECVMKSAGLVEQMGRGHLKPRKVETN